MTKITALYLLCALSYAADYLDYDDDLTTDYLDYDDDFTTPAAEKYVSLDEETMTCVFDLNKMNRLTQYQNLTAERNRTTDALRVEMEIKYQVIEKYKDAKYPNKECEEVNDELELLLEQRETIENEYTEDILRLKQTIMDTTQSVAEWLYPQEKLFVIPAYHTENLEDIHDITEDVITRMNTVYECRTKEEISA